MGAAILRMFGIIAVVSTAWFGLVAFAAADTPGSTDGVYQIVKATEDRVWRLNTQTGEIAVCNLDGANLICTTTTDAATAPKKSFEEIEAERAADAAAQEQAREDRRAQELQILDRILEFARELIQTALGTAPTS